MKRSYAEEPAKAEAFRTFEDLEVYKKARHARYLRAHKFGSSLMVREAVDNDEFLSELDLLFNDSTI